MSATAYYSDDGEIPTISGKISSLSVPIQLSYLNEGGANFVFRISNAGNNVPSYLRQKLLRLRKDLSHVQSAAEQLQAFDKNFGHLFPQDNLVQHEVISLDYGLAEALNDSLDTVDRASHRLGDLLPTDESFGVLVTDMTPREGETLVQLKPKWLAQSPNAPAGAKRCRTCALRAQRASKSIRTATDKQENCPLALINDDVPTRQVAAQNMASSSKIVDFLIDDAQPLLSTLREQQLHLDPFGALNASDEEAVFDICRAMTLRDCTLFVKLSDQGINACLGDLDLKQPEKLERWRDVERSLDIKGWYTNTEAAVFWKEETICVLSR